MMQQSFRQNWIQYRANRKSPRKHLPLCVMSAGSYLVNELWSEHRPKRWFSELFWVFEGTGSFSYGGKAVKAGPGDVFIYFPGTEHRIQSLSKRWGYCWVVFDHADCVRWLEGFGFGEGLHPSGECPTERFRSIGRGLGAGTSEGEMQASVEAYALLVEASDKRKPANKSVMVDAKQFMDERYSDPNLTVQSLSDALGIHRSTLFRLFRMQYGLNPNEYLKNLRLHEALQLVQRGDRSIQDIARICGYTDANYLTKLIRKSLGMSASEMRRGRQIDGVY